MAVQQYAVNRYLALEEDEKPDDAVLGSLLIETDTGDRFIWDGATWVQLPDTILIAI